MKKRFFVSLVFVLVVTLSMSFSSFASTNTSEASGASLLVPQSTVTPMSELCGNCNKGRLLLTGTQYSAWMQTGLEICTSHPNCVVKHYSRQVTRTYTCSYCGIGSYSTATEYRDDHIPV